MRRNPSSLSRQYGRRAAVSLGLVIFLLSCLTTQPALAQDLDLDLPEESGPAGVQPAQPPHGKPEAAVPPTEEPAAEAAREAPQESPQVQYERRTEKGLLSNISDRLLNVLSGDNGANRTAVIGRFQISGEYRDRRDGSSQLENVERLDIPLGDRMIFRTDVPFLRYDPQVSGSASVSGIGDVSMKLGGQILGGGFLVAQGALPAICFWAGIGFLPPSTGWYDHWSVQRKYPEEEEYCVAIDQSVCRPYSWPM